MSAERRPDDGMQRLLALAVSDDLTLAERRRIDEALRYSAAVRTEFEGHAACREALTAAGAALSPADGRPSLWGRIEPRLGPARRPAPPKRRLPWLTAPRVASACAALALLHVGLTVAPNGIGPVAKGGSSVATPPLVAAAPEYLDPGNRAGEWHSGGLGGMGAPHRCEQCGVLVVQLLRGGALERGGLRRGDVILRFDGVAVRTPADVAQCVAGHPLCMPAMIEILRDGVRLRGEVMVGGPVPDDDEIDACPIGWDPRDRN